jgi:hypothetical protein
MVLAPGSLMRRFQAAICSTPARFALPDTAMRLERLNNWHTQNCARFSVGEPRWPEVFPQDYPQILWIITIIRDFVFPEFGQHPCQWTTPKRAAQQCCACRISASLWALLRAWRHGSGLGEDPIQILK